MAFESKESDATLKLLDEDSQDSQEDEKEMSINFHQLHDINLHEADEEFVYANHNNTAEPTVLTVDQILEKLGQCGLFQVGISVIVCLLTFPQVYQILLMYFTGHSPPWKCARNNPECNISGIIEPSQAYLYKKRCYMNRSVWEYTTGKQFSFVTEYDLICDSTPLASLANSALYIGWGLGCLPAGIAADRYGRKHVYFFSFVTLLSATLASGFVTAVWQFIVLRVVIGVGLTGCALTGYVIITEIVGPRCRSVTGNIVFILGTVALLVLTAKAYFIRNWRHLTIICSAPYFALLVFFTCVPEPARWLGSKGKTERALKSLRTIAKVNRTPMPRCQLMVQDQKSAKGNFIDLFRYRRLKFTMLLGFGWMVAGLTYYGISLGSSDLSGNMYRDFALTSVVEAPACMIAPVLLEKCGRRRTSVIAFILAGLSCFFVAMFPEKSSAEILPLLRVIGGMTGKLFISLAFTAIYVWSVELHPTVVRTQGMSFASFMARIGSSSSPFIIDVLKLVHVVLPFILMGCFSIVAGILSCCLPETKDIPTLETLEDDINLHSGRSKIPDQMMHMNELKINDNKIEHFDDSVWSDEEIFSITNEKEGLLGEGEKETFM